MSRAMALALATSILLVMQLIQAAGQDIVGCGGFVEANSELAKLRQGSHPKLDYSHITVKLLTLQGLVKDKTHCAPNGYYFLPVYDKGSFLLKVEGPSGWSFTPAEVGVQVDQNGCNGNEDINFHYTGFLLSGKVLGRSGSSCRAAGNGPSGVKILLTGGPAGSQYSTTTGSGGEYKFENLSIGTYKIEASHPTLDIRVDGPDEVTLGWGNAVVDNIFTVPGYSVEGLVESKGIPVLGVDIFLHSNDIKEVHCPAGPGRSPLQDPALCHAPSDAEGKFKFTNLPCGEYSLVPYYQGENTVFGVSPAALGISVDHQSLHVKEAFQVTGFSIGGRVIDSNGKGIDNVKIFIDDVERAVTDANGLYKLDQVTSTKYTIKAQKEHHKFTTLKDFMVLPNMPSIPSIEATHYSVCGSVRVFGEYGSRQVALTHGPSNVRPQTKRIDEFGKFCFEVPPGEYRLSPLATPVEQQEGLLFSPPHLDVAVTGPVLEAVFVQAQVTIAGHVRCKEQCSPGISVSLLHAQSGEVIKKLNTENDFEFGNVLPGKYRLEVNKDGAGTAEDEWCWEQKVLDVAITTTDVRELLFVQKGYWLRIHSTHAADASIAQENMEPAPLQIAKGWQQVCVESPGSHSLHFLSPCVFFGAHSFSFDSSKPTVLRLAAEKYLLNGYIDVYSRSYPEANNLAESLAVEIRDKSTGQLSDTASCRLVSSTDETATYGYEYWARLGDELVFTPRYSKPEVDVQQAPLFYPREHHVHVTRDDCQPDIPHFAARPGVYLTGSVVPALSGVTVTVTAEKESKTGELQAGSVAMTAVTGEDGTYVAGPLYDDTQYTVQAEKPGYHFKASGKDSFECQRLSQIVVNIVAGEGAEETLPSVLLSLSGDDGYRKNAVALPGGTFTFDSMFPGSFYLRPLLKEYSFTPVAQALELGPGESLKTSFTAQRTGYSIFGTVSSLSGKPEGGIHVEARSESDDYYEQTTTDENGRYRLRGLSPGAIYSVQVVVKEDSHLERASPSVSKMKISTSDTHDVNFVVFEHSPTSRMITGVVQGVDVERWQPQMSVELVSGSKVERKVPVPLSCHFEIADVPSGKYSLRLVSAGQQPLLLQSYKFHTDVVEVDVTRNHYVHVEALRFSAQENSHKQDLSPPPLIPVLVGVSIMGGLLAAVPSLKERLMSSSAGQLNREARKTSQRKRI